MTFPQPRFRIILYDRTGTDGFRGSQKAVVFDAKNIGIEEFANDSGSAYWTLDNDHPQLAEFVPLTRHYEISRWSDARSRWEWVSAGILNDYQVDETQTTFSGLDYMSVLNMRNTPLTGFTSVPPEGAIGQDLTTASPIYATASTAYVDAGTDLTISVATLSSGFGYYPNYTNQNNSNFDTYFAPRVATSITAVWSGVTTSGFDNKMHWVIEAVNPNVSTDDISAPSSPIASGNVIAEVDLAQSGFTSTFNISLWASIGNYINKVTSSAQYAVQSNGDTSWLGHGATYNTQINNSTITDYYSNPYGKVINFSPLLTGVSVTFRIYAAIKRTSTGVWYRTVTPYISLPLTPATSNQSVQGLTQALLESDQFQARTLPHAITVSGTTSTQSHDFISFGEPLLNAIAKVCDLEMGSRTDSAKTIFGIKKPISGGAFTGGWSLKCNISSSAITTFSLRYPDNISSFSHSPGYSKVRTVIYLISSGGVGSGQDATNLDGRPYVPATAIADSSATYGAIPMMATVSGYLPTVNAEREAAKLANLSKLVNTKTISVRLSHNAVELWDNWDIGDTIKVDISRGPVVIYEAFVISGVRWFGESDGSERIQLELVQATAFGARFGK